LNYCRRNGGLAAIEELVKIEGDPMTQTTRVLNAEVERTEDPRKIGEYH